MRLAFFAILILCTATGFSRTTEAQTTGVPCVNDYTIVTPAGLGGISGSTSSAFLPMPGGGPAVITVTGTPTAAVAFIFAKPTPSAPGTFCLPPSVCPIPFTACGGTTNLSYDLTLPVPVPTFVCPMVPIPGAPCTTCVIPVLLPPGIFFSTQTVILDFFCGSPFLHALPTQAYDVAT